MSQAAPAASISVTGNVEGSIVVGDNNFVVHSNHGTIVYKQAAPQVRLRDMVPRPPRPPRGFIGRAATLSELEQRITEREPVLLLGGPGIGKSSVLKKSANGETGRVQPNGVVFVEGIDQEGKTLSRDDLVQLLFDALFESDPPLKVSLASARTYLSNTNPLVVIDQTSLPVGALDSLVDLFPQAPMLVAGGQVGGSQAYEMVQLKPLSQADAVQLLASKAGIEPDQTDQPVLEKIAGLLAGIPLALVTTANLVREKSLRLEQALEALAAVQPVVSEPAQAAIERSFHLAQVYLGEAEKNMLAMAAAVPALSASRPWLETAVGGQDTSQRLESLELLQANSPRLRLHPAYADLVRQTVDPNPILENLLGWMLEKLETHALDFAFMRAELGNLLGLINWAAAQQRWQDVKALGRASDAFLTLGGLWDAWQTSLEKTFMAARLSGDQAVKAWALHQLGTRALGMGEHTQAADLLQRALDLRRKLGDETGAAYSLHNLEALKPPPLTPPSPPGGAGPGPGTRALKPPNRGLRWLVTFVLVSFVFLAGTLTGAYYACSLEIAPVIRALAGGIGGDTRAAELASQPEDQAQALALEPSPTSLPTETQTPTWTPTATASETPLPSLTPTPTATPKPSQTATSTALPSETATDTTDSLVATVKEQATCRYGPGKAYLYADGLFAGDTADLIGRNGAGTWVYIQNHTSGRYCWVSANLVQVGVDVKSLPPTQSKLPHTTEVSIPTGVSAVRSGDTVTITWDQVHVNLVDGRGYLLELSVCQGGAFFPMAVQTDATSYVLTDEKTCAGASGGVIFSVNTRGYTDPVDIPWP